MRIFVIHDARLEQYTDNEYDSVIYGAFTDPDKANAKRDELSKRPNGPYLAKISEIEVDMS